MDIKQINDMLESSDAYHELKTEGYGMVEEIAGMFAKCHVQIGIEDVSKGLDSASKTMLFAFATAYTAAFFELKPEAFHVCDECKEKAN